MQHISGAKSVQKMLASIEKSRECEGKAFLYALCIPMCGHDVSKKLLSTFSIRELMDRMKKADSMDLNAFSDIEGIGPEKSSAFVSWFREQQNLSIAEHLLAEVHFPEKEEETEKEKRCQGMTFVVTGSLHLFENRNAMKEYIEKEGGRLSGSVSKKTTALVTNTPDSGTSKNKKARELDIPILTEEEFVETYGR